MMANKKISKKRIIAGAVAAVGTVAAGSFLWLKASYVLPFHVPAYRADRVIDGDTFVTTEEQDIRLDSVNAPEKGRCGYEEATEELKKLVMNKPLYIKVVFHDKFRRLVAQVYSPDGNVNEIMISKGLAYIESGASSQALGPATDQAREKKLGIFSDKCTQTVNKSQPKCDIKGNDRNGKIYYLPSCGVYPNVTVQLYLGDQWFCTEKEAIKAGFRKPVQCP